MDLSIVGGGGIISPLCMARGNRCPGRFDIWMRWRMRSTLAASKGAGSHVPCSLGRSRPPLGAIHSSLPPCRRAQLVSHMTGEGTDKK